MTIPVLLLGLFIFRGPHITLSLSSARAANAFTLPTCEPNAQGNIDQTVSVSTGSTSAFDWTENAGCVDRPILDTWGVTQNPEEMGVSDQAKSIVQAITPPPAGATNLYRVTYTVQHVIEVTWTLDWLHQIIQGTLADPQSILITITKFSGSTLIQHFNGSITLQKIAPEVTLASLRLEAKVPDVDNNKLGQLGTEVINRLRTGTPFWEGITPAHLVDFE